MKILKTSILTLILSFSFTTILDAADFDCGCSTAVASGGWISSGYYSVNGDCCQQDGNAEVEFYNGDGDLQVTYDTPVDASEHCYGC